MSAEVTLTGAARVAGGARMAPGVMARAREQWEGYAADYARRLEDVHGAYPLSRASMVKRARGEYLPCDGDVMDMLRRFPVRVALAHCSEEARGFIESEPFVMWGQWWDDYRANVEEEFNTSIQAEVETLLQAYSDARAALERADADLGYALGWAREFLGIDWQYLQDVTGLSRATLDRRARAANGGRVPAAYSGRIHDGGAG